MASEGLNSAGIVGGVTLDIDDVPGAVSIVIGELAIDSEEVDAIELELNELGAVLDDGVIRFISTVCASRNRTPPAARRKLSLENWRGVVCDGGMRWYEFE